MLRQALPIALITVAALAPLGAHADEKLTLKSVNVDLPFGDRMFPDGPGSEAVNKQLPGLSLRRHGAHAAGAIEGAMARRGREDAHGLQGADRSQGRRDDRQLSRHHPASEMKVSIFRGICHHIAAHRRLV